MYTCTKQYKDLPAAHRQPFHDGHCQFIHGHNYDFEITFCGNHNDENDFVIDFGKLTEVKEYLKYMFDHTLLLVKTDPQCIEIADKLVGLAQIRIVGSASAEGLAKLVFDAVNNLIQAQTRNRVWVGSVKCVEDSKNWATYHA